MVRCAPLDPRGPRPAGNVRSCVPLPSVCAQRPAAARRAWLTGHRSLLRAGWAPLTAARKAAHPCVQLHRPGRAPVGVSCGQRKLPVLEPEAPLQLLPHPQHVLSRQHEGDSLGCALGHGAHGRLRRVARLQRGEARACQPLLARLTLSEGIQKGRATSTTARARKAYSQAVA